MPNGDPRDAILTLMIDSYSTPADDQADPDCQNKMYYLNIKYVDQTAYTHSPPLFISGKCN